MSERLVWAFQPLKELNNQTGFVDCDEAIAEKLIESGKAQDPAIGAHHFKHIVKDEKAGQTYKTRTMQADEPEKTTPPKKKAAKKKAAKK